MIKIIAVFLMIGGMAGLFESARWAASKSDRPSNWALGALLFLAGFWMWKVS